MNISKDKLDKIRAQVGNEIIFSRNYKQPKVYNTWQKNEDLAYQRKITTQDATRTNIDLGRGEEYISTLLSKIDNSITFKFKKRKDSQLQRVQRLNALKLIDQQNDDWDIKDLAGKEQMIVYGRAIFSYYAESVDGIYKPHLENIDVYDFLIDPSAGGIDLERAFYMGNYGVIKTKEDLRAGVKAKIYMKAETERLIEGNGNADELSQEESNKRNRQYAQGTTSGQKQIVDTDKYVFWRWFTTFEGKRYYMLIQESSGAIIEIDEMENRFASGLYPYWTYARRPSLTEFWTPSPLDGVREIFYTQAVSINQAVDNSEQINNPQRIVNVGAIGNLSELKYKRNGIIRVKGDIDINRAFQTVITPSIDNPIKVFDKLEAIQEKASGLSGGSKGVAEEDKVGIYEGNQANAADRFGLYNKSYSFGYKRFGTLYQWGVREHLTKKVAVEMIGPNGVSQEEVARRDIFRKNEDFTVSAESSQAEIALSETDKKNKLQFLTANMANPTQNPKKAYETSATIVGFGEEEIRELMDTSDFGDAQLMSEAERDIEDILDGKRVKPNPGATTAYKQRFVDFMQHNEDDMDDLQKMRMFAYVESLDQIIISNMARMMNNKIMKQQLEMASVPSEQPPNGTAIPPGGEGTGMPLPPTTDPLTANAPTGI